MANAMNYLWHSKAQAKGFLTSINKGKREVYCGQRRGQSEVLVYNPKTGETRNTLNAALLDKIAVKRFG